MSTVPLGSNLVPKFGSPNGPTCQDKFGRFGWYSQFTGAEMMARNYNITRKDCDAFALDSHMKATAAQKEGRFDREIVTVLGRDKEGKESLHAVDEGVRPQTTLDALAGLETLVALGVCPALPEQPSGVITAGNASQVSDGAAALLIVNEAGLKKLGPNCVPLARITSLALAGTDPVLMLSGPIPATTKALERAGLKLADIDLFEVNEAFACVPLAWQKALGADPARLNVNGGACALGHPLGATGAKLMTTLVHELHRSGKKYGLQAICEGGGTANATIIERL